MAHSTNSQIFLQSGCLTLDAMEAYHEHKLSKDAHVLVKTHMQNCSLCRSAYEGLVSTSDFTEHREHISRLKEKLHSGILPKTDRRWYQSRTFSYLAMAASILLLVGVFSIYRFIIQKEPALVADEPKMLVGGNDTLIGRLQKDVEETESPNITLEKSGKEEFAYQEKIQEVSDETDEVRSRELAEQKIAGAPIDEEKMEKLQVLAEGMDLPDAVKDSLIQPAAPVTAQPAEETMSLESHAMKAAGRTIDGVRSKAAEPNSADKEPPVLSATESKPQFKSELYQNFQAYLAHQLIYPDSAINARIEGVVLIGCDVNQRGKIQNIKIIKSVHPWLDQEATRVVRGSPDWIPAIHDNQPVEVSITIPVEFKLDSILLEKK